LLAGKQLTQFWQLTINHVPR